MLIVISTLIIYRFSQKETQEYIMSRVSDWFGVYILISLFLLAGAVLVTIPNSEKRESKQQSIRNAGYWHFYSQVMLLLVMSILTFSEIILGIIF